MLRSLLILAALLLPMAAAQAQDTGVVEQVLRRTTLADLLTSEQTVSENLSTRHRRSLPVVPIVTLKPISPNPDRTTGDSDDD